MSAQTDPELWRAIPSLPSYLASTHGRIMRVPFLGEMPKGGLRHYGGRPTRGQWTKDQRRYIARIEGQTLKIHRLICEAFHGQPPFDGAVCMHLDENSRNNRPENLKWGTQRENLNAAGFLDYCRGRTGSDNPYVKGRAA